MIVISHQDYRNTERVEAKRRALAASNTTEVTLPCWPVGPYEGEDDLYVLADGHHTLAAALDLGLRVRWDVVAHPEGLTGQRLLDDADATDGADWRDVITGQPVW